MSDKKMSGDAVDRSTSIFEGDVGRGSGPSLTVLLLLHLLPGGAVFFAYLILGGLLGAIGLSPGLVLNLLFAAISIPYIVVFLATRPEARDGGWLSAVRFRNRLRVWQYALLVPLFLVYAIILSVVFAPVSAYLTDIVAAVAPEWFVGSSGSFTETVVPAGLVLAVAILIDGLANPIAEELYFRGYLLPRLKRLGVLAPLVSGILFAAVHLWQPGNIPMLVLLVVPLYYAVWRLRSVYLSIAVHCSANLIGALLSAG